MRRTWCGEICTEYDELLSQVGRLQSDLAKCHEDYKTQVNAIVARDDTIDRLTAIVDKLPKTADGAPIVPGMKVWFQRSKNHGWEVAAEIVGGYYDTHKDWQCIDFDGQRCYSTREAAKAAEANA